MVETIGCGHAPAIGDPAMSSREATLEPSVLLELLNF